MNNFHPHINPNYIMPLLIHFRLGFSRSQKPSSDKGLPPLMDTPHIFSWQNSSIFQRPTSHAFCPRPELSQDLTLVKDLMAQQQQQQADPKKKLNTTQLAPQILVYWNTVSQWKFPKMSILYHILGYFWGRIVPYIAQGGLICGKYLQFRFLRWPLSFYPNSTPSEIIHFGDTNFR